MPGVFVVPNAKLAPVRPSGLGSIGDRQCWGMIDGANGRNFTSVNVVRVGGPGAVTAPLPPSSPLIFLWLPKPHLPRPSG